MESNRTASFEATQEYANGAHSYVNAWQEREFRRFGLSERSAVRGIVSLFDRLRQLRTRERILEASLQRQRTYEDISRLRVSRTDLRARARASTVDALPRHNPSDVLHGHVMGMTGAATRPNAAAEDIEYSKPRTRTGLPALGEHHGPLDPGSSARSYWSASNGNCGASRGATGRIPMGHRSHMKSREQNATREHANLQQHVPPVSSEHIKEQVPRASSPIGTHDHSQH